MMLASFPMDGANGVVSESPENRRFRLPHYRLTPPLQGTPTNIRINLILPESILESFGYIFVADNMGLSSFKFSWWAPKDASVLKHSVTVCNGPSRSSEVVDFGTNRKRVCYFLLVINSNLGPILPGFRDIVGFLLRRATPPLFHPNFRGVPL